MNRKNVKIPPLADLRWTPHRRLLRSHIPGEVMCWLLDPASLTHRVRQACSGRFRVQVLNQGWGRAARSEVEALELRQGMRCIVRQVLLLCDERPWVFARTVIPVSSLEGPQRHLVRLGSRPLGAVLFADKTMRRGVVEVTRIPRTHGLYRAVVPGTKRAPDAIWGRRSVFRVGGKPLLVSEIFLPEIGRCPV